MLTKSEEKGKFMEEKLQEKNVLNAEEIEAQTLLELPDRSLMQATVEVFLKIILAVFASAG
jgi:hypothetical protein